MTTTYQVLVVSDDLTVPYDAPCASLQECSGLVEELEEKVIALQEACDGMSVGAAHLLWDAAPAAVRHFEACRLQALRSDGRCYELVDECQWELVP